MSARATTGALSDHELRYAVAAFAKVDDAQFNPLPNPDVSGFGVDDRIDPQTRLFVQLDQSHDVGRHPTGHQRLADDDVAEDRAFAADFLEVHGTAGVPAALQRWMDPLASVVAAAQRWHYGSSNRVPSRHGRGVSGPQLATTRQR